MSSQEQCDPILELLRRLPQVSPDSEAAARVRHRCHAAMARRTARRTRDHQSGRRWPGRLSDAVLVLSMGLYLAASVAEAVRVVVAF
jgi:hypothetical protein